MALTFWYLLTIKSYNLQLLLNLHFMCSILSSLNTFMDACVSWACTNLDMGLIVYFEIWSRCLPMGKWSNLYMWCHKLDFGVMISISFPFKGLTWMIWDVPLRYREIKAFDWVISSFISFWIIVHVNLWLIFLWNLIVESSECAGLFRMAILFGSIRD